MSATGHDRAYGFSRIATPDAANEGRDVEAVLNWKVSAIRASAALERTKTLRPPIGDREKKRATRSSATHEKSAACLVRAFSLLATSRRRPIARTLGERSASHTNAIEKTASGGAKGAFFSSRRFSARTARRAHATRDAHVERTTDPGHTRSRSIATNVSTDAHANATRAPSPGMKHENSGDEEGAPPAIPIPKRRRTSEKVAPRSTAGKTKKKDAGASEDDINSLFWLVEVRAGSVANAPYPTRARQLDS